MLISKLLISAVGKIRKGFRFFFILMMMLGMSSFAQSQELITGMVTSEGDGMPLPGVNVIIQGTSTGTVTDIDGNYSIEASENDVLVFSFLGFKQQEIQVGTQTEINVSLAEDMNALDDVVVVGYGTQRKEDLTSAVSSVDSEDFIQSNVTDAGQLIQGKVAGLSISMPSGDPTASSQIRLRGTSSILGSNTNPLILIDGIPGDLKTVPPEDIKSIDVLKDGSAAAIYGTRGTNGVILITTKRASGAYTNQVDYSVSLSTQQIFNQLDVLSASDYRRQIENGTRDASADAGSSTDWLDEITQTPFTQVHNLTLRGGNNTTNYLATINLRDLEGIFLKSDNTIFTGRVDINHYMFDEKLKINLGIIGRSVNYTTTGDGSSFNGYTYRQALIRNPTEPIKNPDGSWYEVPGNFNYDNPVSRLNESDGENKSQFLRYNAQLTYEPIEDLKLSALGSLSRYNQTRGYAESKDHISNVRGGVNGFVSNGTRETEDRLLELTAQYSKTLMDDHDFNLLAGYSYQENYYRDYYMTNSDFPTDIFTYHNIGLGRRLEEGQAGMGSNTTKTNLIGFFGRLNYNYKDKYLLMGSVRHEAASQLYKTNEPWGTFPAFSAGWRVSEEEFLRNSNIIDNLKLRFGYGVTGIPNQLGFGAVALLGYGQYFYYNDTWVRTLSPSQNPNPDLKWEEKHEYNYGIDFTLFNNIVSGSIDYYNRNVQDLLFDFAVPTPPNLYGTTRANVGEMKNSGLEVMLNINPINKEDFQWSTNVGFSTNSNELVSLSNNLYQTENDYFTTGGTGEPIQTFTHRVRVGDPIGNFYGFKVVDIDDDGRWIYETPSGEIQNYDEFGHSFEDKQVLGNGLPNYYANWNNTFKYKDFDLSITMRGAFDYQILNFERMYLENPTIDNYNRLQSSEDAVFGKTALTSPLEYNSYYIEDGDFWKIDNITLGYNFSEIGKYIKSARVYVSTLNTFTFTGYDGIDPEVNRSGLSPGNDGRDKYPTTRTYTLGFNVSF
ncbi:TonB-linked outer membrane protein, SusC/RagA family [Zunongwangia mangrovi]|uniref:TonB-linked outer membrane protein, SusC/RagA family n=1 Tax=Zunongwangia mangrovi TaxID=1334022 RepID=A0A1I1L5S7_9FLAO|nr:SusC/RagA family TonB-linked outer membrane protein [Zunongwangia mangrovi]SFC68305.1 TonB-linked outer membrane protein, SusC/RagA family [Zunongwangia mangrovi]